MSGLALGLKAFGKGFKGFGEAISEIVNVILLTLVYLIGVGLTSIIAKIVGKKFMQMHVDKKAKTYWKDMSKRPKDIDAYYRQF